MHLEIHNSSQLERINSINFAFCFQTKLIDSMKKINVSQQYSRCKMLMHLNKMILTGRKRQRKMASLMNSGKERFCVLLSDAAVHKILGKNSYILFMNISINFYD